MLSIAKDFTPYPFGRYRDDGDYSGEAFRDDLLWPLLQRGEAVTVLLDGVKIGLGSSFLEEVFGGLIEKHRMSLDKVRELLRIVSEDDPSLASKAWVYLDEANERSS